MRRRSSLGDTLNYIDDGAARLISDDHGRWIAQATRMLICSTEVLFAMSISRTILRGVSKPKFISPRIRDDRN
jgi:hypothetical protein